MIWPDLSRVTTMNLNSCDKVECSMEETIQMEMKKTNKHGRTEIDYKEQNTNLNLKTLSSAFCDILSHYAVSSNEHFIIDKM